MKKNIILGTSAFILAIAGAFATKASSKIAIVTGWTRIQDGTGTCGTHSFPSFCTWTNVLVTNRLCTAVVNPGYIHRTLYLKDIDGLCIVTLRTISSD